MKERSYWPLLFLGILLVYLAFRGSLASYWNSNFDSPPLLVFGAFAGFGISAMLFGNILLYTFFVPGGASFNFLTLMLAERRGHLANEIGERRVQNLYTLNSLLFALLFVFFYLATLAYVKSREHQELEKYGQEQTVQIKEIRKSIKGLDLAHIEYQFEGKTYSKELHIRQQQQDREIAKIIFSSRTPEIVQWKE